MDSAALVTDTAAELTLGARGESSPEPEYAPQASCASRVTPARPPRGTEGRPPRRHRSRPASRRRYRAAPRHLEPSCTIAAHAGTVHTPNCFVCGVAFCKSSLYPCGVPWLANQNSADIISPPPLARVVAKFVTLIVTCRIQVGPQQPRL